MSPGEVKLVKIHENTNLIDECVRILNEEWPRDASNRIKSMKKSSDNFPMSLALIDSERNVLGFVKLSSDKPISPILFVESLVVEKNNRHKGLGRFIMNQVENIAKERQFKKIHLTTTDQEQFYCKIGYKIDKYSSIFKNKANNTKILMYKNI